MRKYTSTQCGQNRGAGENTRDKRESAERHLAAGEQTRRGGRDTAETGVASSSGGSDKQSRGKGKETGQWVYIQNIQQKCGPLQDRLRRGATTPGATPWMEGHKRMWMCTWVVEYSPRHIHARTQQLGSMETYKDTDTTSVEQEASAGTTHARSGSAAVTAAVRSTCTRQ